MATQSFHHSAAQPAIRRIALVGGFKDFRNEAAHPDNQFVTMTHDYLNRSGMTIADDAEIDVINFVNGREFLQEDKEYDAVYIAFIPQGINMSHTRMSFNTYSKYGFDGTDTVAIRDKSRNTIATDNSPKKWMDRICVSKAKIIVARSGCIEVDLNYLQKAPAYNAYQTLLTPGREAGAIHRGASDFGREDVEKLYGEKLDVPFQWLGVAAKPAYLHAIRSQLQQADTSLAKRALQVLKGDAPVPAKEKGKTRRRTI